MKKSRLLLPILGIILLNVIFVSCADNYKDLINDEDNIIQFTAPLNIVGKKLALRYESTSFKQAFNFSTSNTCNITTLTTGVKLTSTPSYTYTKKDKCTAYFTLSFSQQLKVGSNYSNWDYFYDLLFNFSSETGGTFTGTESFTKKSNVTENNMKQTSISGTFTLY